MSVVVDKDNNVIITFRSHVGAIHELRQRRLAILDLVAMSKPDELPDDAKYHALQFLFDTEPSEEQWNKALEKK